MSRLTWVLGAEPRSFERAELSPQALVCKVHEELSIALLGIPFQSEKSSGLRGPQEDVRSRGQES